MRTINKLIGSLMFAGITIKKRLNPNKSQEIPILGYHKINGHCELDALNTPVKLFEEQMLFLSKREYTTISLDDLPLYYAGELSLPEKPVIITFDDGFKDNYLCACPVLEKYGFAATIFLVSQLVGKKESWEKSIERDVTAELISWEEARGMKQDVITFGSHTRTHPYLTRLTHKQARREIVESKREIESKLKRPVKFFCYPYGDFNEELEQMVKKAGYLGACTVVEGLNKVGGNLYRLKRVMSYYDEAHLLEGTFSGAFNFLKYSDRVKNWLGRISNSPMGPQSSGEDEEFNPQ